MTALRISIYIVTYRNPVDLNRNIASILSSGADVRINIINNHSQFFLEPRYQKTVTVLHNSLRPDFSTGHLSRNWNQALLHGFKDLKNPASDVVVTVQDDVIFKPDWLSRLVDLHRRYNFITQGLGDAFCSYLPDAVRKVGLWDERFCHIGWSEGDYFLRSLIYNRQGCSINDPGHGRLHNALGGSTFHPQHFFTATERADSLLITTPQMNFDRRDAHASSLRFHGLGETIFKHKWGLADCPWTAEHYAIRTPLVPSYVMYPYFEKDVEGLRDKNYIVATEETDKRWAGFVAEVRDGADSTANNTGAAAPGS
jgi:hypothetical protein